MSDPTTCRKCGDRIWWEESAISACWMSTMNGSWCVNESSHEPETIDCCPYDCSICHTECGCPDEV